MRVSQHWAIEAHVSAVTLYITGPIAVAELLAACRRCDHLPDGIWLMRVDVRRGLALDAGTRAVLAHALRRWREGRGGVTQALHPPNDVVTRRRHLAVMFSPWRRT